MDLYESIAMDTNSQEMTWPYLHQGIYVYLYYYIHINLADALSNSIYLFNAF